MISLALLLLAVPVQDACSFPETKVLARELADGLRALESGQHGVAAGHLAIAIQKSLPREQLVCAHFALAVASRGLEEEQRQARSIESAGNLHERAAASVCSALAMEPTAQPPAAIQDFVQTVRFGCGTKLPKIRPSLRLGVGLLGLADHADGRAAFVYGNPYLFYGLSVGGWHFGVAAGTGAVDKQAGVGFVGAAGFGFRPFWKSRRLYRLLGATALGGERWTTGRSDTKSPFFTLGVDCSLPPVSRQGE